MPRYAVTTNLSKKEDAKLEAARKKLGWSRYKFFQKAIMAYCRAVEKEKIEVEQKRNGNGETVRSESESRRQRTVEVSY